MADDEQNNKLKATNTSNISEARRKAMEREAKFVKEKENYSRIEEIKKQAEERKLQSKNRLLDSRKKNVGHVGQLKRDVIGNVVVNRVAFDKNSEKKAEEKRILDEAMQLLDNANNEVKKGNFNNAKELFKNSSRLFIEIGWNDQSNKVLAEIDVIDKKERELLDKKRMEEEKKLEEQRAIEEIIRKDMEEKERLKKLEEENKEVIDPEIEKKIEMARMNYNKGKTAQSKEKLQQAISRFNIALELFKEAGYDGEEIDIIENLIKKINRIHQT